MKILQFGDVHYDEKNHDEIKKCMEFLISQAEEEQPGAIICTGDVTNSEFLGASTKSARTIMDQFRRLSDIAPVAVIIGTPSHDGQTPKLLEFVSGKYPIHVSTTIEQIILVGHSQKQKWFIKGEKIWEKGDINLVVSQVPAPTKEHWKNRQGVEKDNFNIAEAMGSIFANFGNMAKEYNCPHVLNGHFLMVGSRITETQLLPGGDISINPDTIAMANADLICLGHIHMVQAYQVQGKEIAFHNGSIFRKNYGERNEDKGFFIHELKNESDAPFIPQLFTTFITTPTRAMHQEGLDLIKYPEVLNEDFIEDVLSLLVLHTRAGSFIKIKIKIYMDDIRMINQAKLKRLILEAGASEIILDIDRVRRENSRDEEILKAVTLPEKITALAEHQSKPAPEGIMDMLENIETMNEDDLVKYALSSLGEK